MSWAGNYIRKLQAGETISFRPRGNSMSGRIESGQLCTVEPAGDDIQVGDVVLCKVSGKHYLHFVKAIQGERYQIANNKGHINGWAKRSSIYGKLIRIDE